MGGKWSSMDPSQVEVPEINTLLERDPYLKQYESDIRRRYALFKDYVEKIEEGDGDLKQFTTAYESFGIHIQDDNSVVAKEWAPGAQQVFLTGEFNNWQKTAVPYEKLEYGKWELHLPPNADGSCPLKHNSEVKLIIKSHNNELLERLSPWATYVTQKPDKSEGTTYKQRIWHPENVYKFKHPKPKKPKSLRIYECHIGIGTQECRVGTYLEFARDVIPRIVKQGYNAIQVMAIMEHAYYASFGYQVTSFYAVSSRYGNPEELKELVDVAHQHNLYVLLDVVHSHASKNTLDGLNMFDGTDACFFHSGSRGEHSLWDSRLFNYAEYEVLRFLLSNLRWYIEEYSFDGFRFDGVTSMLYHSRGLGQGFSGHYDEYYGLNVDVEGIIYLMLANHMLHEIYSEIVTIAEDVSGMPGVCRPVTEGGIGFDYRLAMAIPDKWIKLLKEVKDDDWKIGDICWTLSNRRWMEKAVAYSESHDQALVGDKTIAFWLMDKEMYTHMSTLSSHSDIISRGIALHNLITLITHALGGEAYLSFMGNEFGHPEWLDFLRHFRLRVVWDGWLHVHPGYVSWKHEDDKVIVFDRSDLTFVFNFHPVKSFADYPVGVKNPGTYKIVLCSDDEQFGGECRVNTNVQHFTQPESFSAYPNKMMIYIPRRTALVYAQIDG
ncbi:PREDICTED: 1,4-alpha-glucan-branching enzyme [Cyphomyrmex costatus]|uniref:1,4-alpha-glucan-branching enzyme n=1 Tax=Cyphomyrmex costatus TaxID=456900 RepID=UPI0008524485|nr:PREDICTED: 1,4-alpha-glucan-branching enzyme [Cyphomyrmex costatus]